MPKTNLRTVLEDIAAKATGLNEQDAAALLDMHLASIQACKPGDELAALIKVGAGAGKALQLTAKQALASKLAASHQLVLAQALEKHSQLIAAKRKERATEVEETRRMSEAESDDIKDAIAKLTKKSPVDLEALRKQVKLEFARAKNLDAVLKQALADGVAVAPSPAKVSFADNQGKGGASEWTPEICEQAFCTYTWFQLKDLRKSKAEVKLTGLVEQKTVTDDVMWKLYQFRRHVVDDLIKDLHAQFPRSALLFKSAGSEDIESDLDITVASKPPGDDVRAMEAFNAAINERFKRPPGRVFDTNLYARDYGAIEDNMTKERQGEAPKDVDIDEPEGEMAKMSRIDQDVATLMKQRRFLDEKTFTTMWHQLRDSIKGNDKKAEENRKRIQQRFEEGEAVYLLTAVEKVQVIEAAIEKKHLEILESSSKGGAKPTADQVKAFKAFDEAKKAFEKARADKDLRATQILLPTFLDLMEEKFPDEVMDVTDKLYAKRMTDLRKDQNRLAHADKGPDYAGADCDEVHPGKTHEEWFAELDGLKARIKQAQFTNIIFANEAYVSQGAIAHVVAGIQASTPEKKAEVLKKITPEQLLQSGNEQIADFLKDMKHMEHAEKAAAAGVARHRATGEAFVHASKYLSRMLDAAAMLEEKYQGDEAAEEIRRTLTTPPYKLCQLGDAGSPRQLKTKIDEQLVSLRKSSTLAGDAKAELAMDDVKKMFNVESVDQLRQLIIQFSLEFNRRVRLLKSFEDAQVIDAATHKQYFAPKVSTAPAGGI